MKSTSSGVSRRSYELGKRLEQMDESRAAILRAAREELESRGYRQWTMGSLAARSGVTRQTIHNLFGTKAAVLEALFDVIALNGGMERMREVMAAPSADEMLRRYVEVFCRFWISNRLLIRRIHGVGAIDPEFGAVIEDRNERRFRASMRIVSEFGFRDGAKEKAAGLTALTSFEFFDALAETLANERQVTAMVMELSKKLLGRAVADVQVVREQ